MNEPFLWFGGRASMWGITDEKRLFYQTKMNVLLTVLLIHSMITPTAPKMMGAQNWKRTFQFLEILVFSRLFGNFYNHDRASLQADVLHHVRVSDVLLHADRPRRMVSMSWDLNFRNIQPYSGESGLSQRDPKGVAEAAPFFRLRIHSVS